MTVFEWLNTSLVELPGSVTITHWWWVAALLALLPAYLATRKRRSAPIWYGAALLAGIGIGEIVRAAIPDANQTFAQGEQPGAGYAMWSDASFRADFGLVLILVGLAVVLAGAIRALYGRAGEESAAGRASTIGGALVVIFPLVAWAWAAGWFATAGDYPEILTPVVAALVLALISGVLWYRLEGWPRTLAWGVFVAAVLLAQLRYNATRPAVGMFDMNGSYPAFLALLPPIFGALIAQHLRAALPFRRLTRLLWHIGAVLWATVMVGWLVKVLGFYDHQGSYAFDLSAVLEAPLRLLLALSDLYYDAVPRTITAENNIDHMQNWMAVLVVTGGVLGLLAITRRVWRARVLDRRETLADRLAGWRTLHLTLDQKRWLLAFVLITPAVGLRTFTTFYPFLQTVALSVQKYNPAFPPRSYVGLRNFERLASDLVVRESMEFTLLFVFGSTFFQIVLGLAIAHLLNARFRLRSFSRTISLIPWAIPMVVAAIGFRWMFDDQFGMIPDMLRRLFGYNGRWLVDPENAQVAVTFVNTWKSTPFAALLLLAGLQGISEDLYEAARVDGANWLEQLRFITVPMLMPIIVTTTMFLLVWQLAAFDLPFAMTGGGPGFSTTVLTQKIYLEINSLNYSFAAAISIALVFIVTLIGGAGLYALRRVEVSA